MSNMPPPSDPYQSPGNYPVPPPGQGGGTGRPAAPQPSSIATAVKLMYLGAALSALGTVITIVTIGSLRDQVRDRLRDQDASVSQSTIDAAVTLGIVIGIFFGLVGIGLWLWMAWKNGQGRSWARVVATVLGGLNLLSTIYSLASGQSTVLSQIFAVLNLILAIAIIVLLWRKESTAFYQARSAPTYG